MTHRGKLASALLWQRRPGRSPCRTRTPDLLILLCRALRIRCRRDAPPRRSGRLVAYNCTRRCSCTAPRHPPGRRMAVAWCTRKLVQHAQPSELSLRLKLLKLRVHLSQLAQHCPAQRDPRTTELVWRAKPTKPNAQGRGARWRMGCAAAHTAFELRVTRLHERLVIVSIAQRPTRQLRDWSRI